MPTLTLPIRRRGALLKVLVRPAPEEGAELETAGEFGHAAGPLPAYLDTGASDTVLDLGVVASLGLRPLRAAALHVLGREGVSFHETFAVAIAVVPAEGAPHWIPLTVLAGAVYQTGAALALGRDFLRHVVLTYDGPAARVTLQW